ncbi:MAG: pitrilysin family protein [Candidatus Paceibacterota bacterium]|jgi:predicted Zn-dependent peptidase
MKHTKTILDNGVRVITVPMEGNPTVTVMVTVGTGSYHEEEGEFGLSHFLEHMCFKGTSKRPTSLSITTELDGMGAIYNAFTSNEITGYYAKADSKHFDRIGDIVVDIYKNSIFPEAEIEKEKGVVLGEIDMYSDEPQEKISDALREFMYRGQVAARQILGTKDTVRSFTRADILRYRDMQYKAQNTLVTIAGGVSEDFMLSFARSAFGDMSSGEARAEFKTVDREQSGPETVFLEKDTDQAHMILAWRTFDRSHKERFAARIVNALLRGGMSSRLFIKLRDEMGSGYYIGSGHETYSTFGQFHISTGTTAERAPEIATAIIGEVRRLQDEVVPQGELEKIKELIRSRVRMSLETSDGVADFFAEQEMFEDAVRSPEELDVVLSSVTAEDVIRVSKILFDPCRLTFAAIGKGIDREAVSKAIAA